MLADEPCRSGRMWTGARLCVKHSPRRQVLSEENCRLSFAAPIREGRLVGAALDSFCLR